MIQTIKNIKSIIDEIQFELTLEDEGTFFLLYFCGIKNFESK